MVLGVLNNNRLTGMQGKKKKNLFSYNMHLVLPYLLNDSNDLLKEKFFQNPTLRDANLQ